MAKNNEKFVSRENAKTLWGYMVDLLTGKYTKPSGGIPKSDLESSVQTSLGKADTALQSFEETDPTVPSWAKATNKPSYTQDEVGDGTTYKRVSSTEKDIWNAKGTYSKPSGGIPKSDLASAVQTSLEKADSALQSYTETDPTVPSWAKQTSKPSYNSDEISDTNRTHKFATQSQLNQISTNQTNILYGTRTGAQNLLVCNDIEKLKRLNNTSGSWEGNVFKDGNGTFTINDDGSITVNGTFTVQTFLYLENDNIISASRFKDLATVRLFGCATGGSESSFFLAYRRVSPDYYWFDVGSGVDIGTISASEKVMIFIGVRANVTMSNKTFYPALVLKSIYNQDPNFCPGALPNYDLTYLQAEDRASLAEVVDSGAKNLYNPDALSGVPTGLTITRESDGTTLKINGTHTGTSYAYITVGHFANAKTGIYYMSSTCTKATNPTTYYIYTSDDHLVNSLDSVSSYNYTSAPNTAVTIRVSPNASFNNDTVKILISTKAAFGVSNKFVPYRPNYDLVSKLMPIYKSENLTTNATYTLANIYTIVPPKSIVRITGRLGFGNSAPRGIILSESNSSSDFNSTSKLICTPVEASDNNIPSLHNYALCINTGNTARNVYIWVKSSVDNKINAVQLITEWLGDA